MKHGGPSASDFRALVADGLAEREHECAIAASAGNVDAHWLLLNQVVFDAGVKVFAVLKPLEQEPSAKVESSKSPQALRAYLRKQMVTCYRPGHLVLALWAGEKSAWTLVLATAVRQWKVFFQV